MGGLELGGIFGTNLRVREFLAHCSPRLQQVKGSLEKNAAFADKRLDGKRSKRMETLCKANAGRGSPCDFISIHAYNASKLMADKLIKAKEIALEIDADYYARLWVNSHEACPEWNAPADPAYGDSYLGNGYFPTWCADVATRQLRKAAEDKRYGYGESILTVWPWANAGFHGGNDTVRAIRTDDGKTVTVAMPILHFLGLVAQMGPKFHVLPERTVGGHVVSGFASQSGKATRVMLYSHSPLDTESRSDASFDVELQMTGLEAGKLAMTEYRFDKDHNSYFRLGRELRDQGMTKPADADRLQEVIRKLESDQVATQLAGLEQLAAMGPSASSATETLYYLHERSNDEKVKAKAIATLGKLTRPSSYPAGVVKKIEEQSQLQSTNSSVCEPSAGGAITLRVRLSGNGANFIVLEPVAR